jgi:TRAP-type mannitol/chloroaromatic compound transport system substrate-binding protein
MKKSFMLACFVFVIAALFMAGLVSPASAKTFRLRGQAFVPSGFPILWDGAEYFAKRAGELSGGRLNIEMLPSGTIVPMMEMIDAVHKGVLDVSCGWAGYWRGSFPAAPLFGAIECGPGTMEFLGWVLAGGGIELWQEMYDRKNWQVKVLPPFSAHGPEDLAWANKPIRTLDDFKGLRFRTGGYYWGKVLERMGASVVTLPGSEVIPSLERGVIDAGEYSMPCIDIKMGFHEICEYLILPGIHQPSSLDETLVHKKTWDKLPKDLQDIMWSAARESSLYIMNREMVLNPPALEAFRAKGVKILILSPEAQAHAKKVATAVHEETAAKEPFFKKVLEAQREFSKTWKKYESDFYKFDYME